MSHIDSIMKRNLVSQYGLQIAKYLLPFIVLIYLARVLESDAYGFRAYTLSVMSILQIIADFGFQNSATKDVVECGNDPKRLYTVVKRTTYAKLILLVLLSASVPLLVVHVPMLSRDVPFVVVSFVSVAFNVLLFDFVFMGKEQMGILTVRYVATKILYIVLIAIFVKSDNDLLVVAVLDAVTSCIAWIWTFVSMSRSFEFEQAPISIASIYSCLRESAYYFVSRAATTLYTALTTLILGIVIADTTQIAIWSISIAIIGAIQALFTPINNVLYPRIIATRDLGLVAAFIKKCFPLVVVVTLAVAFLSSQILLIVGGDSYAAGSEILAILSLLIPLGYFGVLFGWPTLGAFGKVKELTRATLVAAIVNIVLLIVLIALAKFTLLSVAISRCVAECVMVVLRGIEVIKLKGLS